MPEFEPNLGRGVFGEASLNFYHDIKLATKQISKSKTKEKALPVWL
jgi:hypothetical protein